MEISMIGSIRCKCRSLMPVISFARTESASMIVYPQ